MDYAFCPICDAEVRRRISADFAPFLRVRCKIPPDRMAFANFCDACEHLFFTPLLTPVEIERLYTNYRHEDYLSQRLETEPSYDPDHVYFLDEESVVRAEYYCHFLPEYRNTTGTILDFGGGRSGAARWAFPDAELIVVDHDHEALGIDLQELASRADLLLCAHVFEHVPEPLPLLSKLIGGMRRGTYVYLELPKEYPGRLADVFEQLEAQDAAEEPFSPVPQRRVHEHIAHFSKRSAQRLLMRAGASPFEIHQADVGILGVLAIVDTGPFTTLPDPPRLPRRYPNVAFGQLIDFKSDPSLSRYLVYGWRKPKDGYVWSSGARARLAVPTCDQTRGVALILSINPLVSGGVSTQRVEAWLDGNKVDQASATEFGTISLLLPRRAATDTYLDLRFPDATTPKRLGLSTDESLLSIQLISMCVRPLPVLSEPWLSTGLGGPGEAALLAGWRPGEDGFTWSEGGAATIAFNLEAEPSAEFFVNLDLTPLIQIGRLDAQRLAFSSGGTELGLYAISGRSAVKVHMSSTLVKNGIVRLEIELPDATSPAALGLANDQSILAVQIYAISLERA